MGFSLEMLAKAQLTEIPRVLVIGAPPFAHADLVRVQDLEQLDAQAGAFAGALWKVDRELREGVRQLRPHLLPGARLLLAVELRRAPWQAVRDAVSGRKPPSVSFEAACEAVLLAGLRAVQVQTRGTRWLVLSALLPARPDPLDAVFTQPG